MPCPGPVTTLSDEDKALFTARLKEAQDQYHNLMTGQAVATLRDQNGETITYTIANVDKLAGYITWLQSQLGISATRTRPPARTYMGR